MAGSVSVEQPASVWPPVPSTSATASTVPDPNSHLGFSLPQHPYAEGERASNGLCPTCVSVLATECSPYALHIAFLRPPDPNPLEAFGYERLELPWWGCTAESPSLLTGSVGASTAAGSSTSCRRSPFLYAPPAAQQSISGVMSGMAPHSSLFDQSEAECMDHWFSALKGDSLMGTVAEWHEKGTQQHFQHSRRHKSNGGANNTLSKSQPSPRKEASVDTPNGLHEKQQQPEVNGPSSGRAAPAKKRRKSTPQAQQIGERGQERELPPATAKMQPDLSPSPPQEAATGGSAADLQYQSQLKQRSKLPLTSQQKVRVWALKGGDFTCPGVSMTDVCLPTAASKPHRK